MPITEDSPDWQTTIDRLFVRIDVPIAVVCPACGHGWEQKFPGVLDWRDRTGIEWLHAMTAPMACAACRREVAVQQPVLVLRPGDPIAALIGFPRDTPLDEDRAALSKLMHHPDLGTLRPAHALPARLDHLNVIADRYSGFALAGIYDGSERTDSAWESWIEAMRDHVAVPALAEQVTAYIDANTNDDAAAYARSGGSLLDPAWLPVVELILARTVAAQTDPEGAEYVRRRTSMLRGLRHGDGPPTHEVTLDPQTRALLEQLTDGTAASMPDRLQRMGELLERLRRSPEHQVLLVAAMITYVAVAASPSWRTPESLAHAITVGAEAADLAADVFGPAHPITMTAVQDHAATLLDTQVGSIGAAQQQAMALFARTATAAVASGGRDLADVLQNWAAALAHHHIGGRTDNQELGIRLFRDALHTHRVLRPLDTRGAFLIRLNTAAALRERRSGNVAVSTHLAVGEYLAILHDSAVGTALSDAEIAQGWANFVTAQFQLRQLRPDDVTVDDIVATAVEAARRCESLTAGDPVRIGGFTNIGSVIGDLYQDLYRADDMRTDLLDLATDWTGRANDDARRWLTDAHADRIRVGQNHVANLNRPHPGRENDATDAEALLVDLLSATDDDELVGHRHPIAMNLGRHYTATGRWYDAIDAFEIALEATHRLYRQARTSASRIAELGVAGDIAGWLAILRLTVDDAAGAVDALERSRARLLTDDDGPAVGADRRRPVLYVGTGILGSWIIAALPDQPIFGVRSALSAHDLRPLVTDLRRATPERLSAALDAVCAAIAPAILQPVRLLLDELQLSDIDVVVSGLLSGLPLHALPDGGAAGGCWLDYATIRYVPSATVAARWSPWSHHRSPVLAYADRELDCAAQEPAMIPQHLGALMQVPAHGDISEWLLNAFQRAGHAHLACHAHWNQDEPLASTIRINGSAQVTLAQILALDCRDLDLAVLSCCSTGVAVEALSDELIGFGTGIFLAGARAVVVSTWNVDDLASSLVMAFFYRILTENPDPGAALRSAQQMVAALTVDDLERLWQESLAEQPEALLPPVLGAEAYREAKHAKRSGDHQPFRHPAYWAGYAYHGPAGRNEDPS